MILGVRLLDGGILIGFSYVGIMISHFLVFSVLGGLALYLKKKGERQLPKKYIWGVAYGILPTEKFCVCHRVNLPDSSVKRYVR